jgi:hypothetical protein
MLFFITQINGPKLKAQIAITHSGMVASFNHTVHARLFVFVSSVTWDFILGHPGVWKKQKKPHKFKKTNQITATLFQTRRHIFYGSTAVYTKQLLLRAVATPDYCYGEVWDKPFRDLSLLGLPAVMFGWGWAQQTCYSYYTIDAYIATCPFHSIRHES